MNVHSPSQPNVPTPDRPRSRSSDADSRSSDSLLRQARLSPGEHARYQRRSRHQRGIDLSLFRNKEAVISAMADRHKKEIQEVLERARQAPTLLESLEILF